MGSLAAFLLLVLMLMLLRLLLRLLRLLLGVVVVLLPLVVVVPLLLLLLLVHWLAGCSVVVRLGGGQVQCHPGGTGAGAAGGRVGHGEIAAVANGGHGGGVARLGVRVVVGVVLGGWVGAVRV